MSSNHPDPRSPSPEGMGFVAVDTISTVDRSPSDILSYFLQHEETGTPLVIRGLNIDPNWLPLPEPDLSEEHRDVDYKLPADAPEQQDAPPKDAFVWVRELSLIPSEILPPGPREPLPVTIERSERTQIDVDGPGAGRPLKQNHCASTFHRLTLDSVDVASDVWFILEASHAHQMEAHLSALPTASQPTFMATSELLSSPFPVYRHAQMPGDLLVIPPRCYAQNLREGASTSVSWSRMSIHGLGLALHYELPMYRRLCIPEKYGIRKMIYAAMKSYTSTINESLSDTPLVPPDSPPDLRDTLSHIADGLQKLILSFDEVLLDGYSEDHDSLYLADYIKDNPTCDYCGTHLFLSYFSCDGVCFDLETVPSLADLSIVVCGACYVEGRSCVCRDMVPRRLHIFSDLLQERNDAASALSKYAASRSDVNEVDAISERYFLWPRIAVFRAAKELWKLKKAPENDRRSRTCTPRGGEQSHTVSSISLINCKKCHAAKCFRHILNGKVHCSEALLANAADQDSTIWHQIHQTARQRNILSRGTQGKPFGIAEQLAFFVSNFSSVSPIRSKTSVGFYDGHGLQALGISESIRRVGEGEDRSFTAPSSTPTVRSRASSRSTAIPHSDTAEGSERPPAKPQRPPAKPRRPPAKSRRIRRRPTEHEDTDFEPGTLGSKRSRNQKSGDKAEPPSKRIRLRPPSIETLQLTDSQSSIPSGEEVVVAKQQDIPQLQRPDELESSQSEGDHSQTIESGDKHTSSASWSLALQRKPTRTVSTSSLPLNQASSSSFPPSRASSSSLPLNQASTASVDRDPPLAFNFFNPATDIRRGESLVPSLIHPSRRAEQSLASTSSQLVQSLPRSNSLSRHDSFPPPPTPGPSLVGTRSRVTQPLRRWDSSSRLGSSISLPPPSPTLSSPQFRPHSGGMSVRGASLFAHGPPTGGPHHLAPEDIRRELLGRRDSQEDLDAQRVLGTMQGDSLSKENLQGYVNLLRESGAFDQSM